MKTETENLLRNMLSLDPEIERPNIEKAIDILRGNAGSDDALVHVLRYKEVCDLLHIHRRTLDYYIEQGFLDRVYGRGARALGISRDSFIRFTTQRTIVVNRPVRKRRPTESAVLAHCKSTPPRSSFKNNKKGYQR